jgi:hypothetical protein
VQLLPQCPLCVFVCLSVCLSVYVRGQGVINGTYDAAVFGPTVLQAPLVMKLNQPIVSGMKTSFFRRPMILDRAAAMAMASATPAPTGGNPSMRSDKGDLDGYRAGIIVLALITFFLVIAVIVVAMRKPAVPGV